MYRTGANPSINSCCMHMREHNLNFEQFITYLTNTPENTWNNISYDNLRIIYDMLKKIRYFMDTAYVNIYDENIYFLLYLRENPDIKEFISIISYHFLDDINKINCSSNTPIEQFMCYIKRMHIGMDQESYENIKNILQIYTDHGAIITEKSIELSKNINTNKYNFTDLLLELSSDHVKEPGYE